MPDQLAQMMTPQMGPPNAEEALGNPLAQMMQGGGAPPPNPSIQGPPTGLVNPPASPIDQQIAELDAQLKQNIAKLQQPIQSQIPPELQDFDKYNNAKYEQAYGGGGVLGVAGRTIANLMSGVLNKGQTIRETLTEQNRKEYQVALQAQAQRIQQQKAQDMQVVQTQAQQLALLRSQQQAQQQVIQLSQGQQRTDAILQNATTNAAKAKVSERQGDRRLDILAQNAGKEASTPFAAIRDKINKERKADGQPELSPAELLNLREETSGDKGATTTGSHFYIDGDNNLREYKYDRVRTPNTTGSAIPELAKPGATPATSPSTGTSSGGGGTVIGSAKPPSSIIETQAFAKTALTHIEPTMSLINKLDKEGKLNIATTRWNEFMAGKVGSGDPDYEALRFNVGLLRSALARIHGGARGGGSIQMTEYFENLLSNKQMNAETLKSGMHELTDWLDEYSRIGDAAKTIPKATGSTTKPKVKILKVE